MTSISTSPAGLRIGEPAADLAVAAALVSALAETPVPADTVVFGEIGLVGPGAAGLARRCAAQGGGEARLCRGLVPARPASARPPFGRRHRDVADRPSQRAGRPPCPRRAPPPDAARDGRLMNPLDIGVIAVIGLSAVFAFARGFVREALSIVAWVGAGFVTLYGFRHVYRHRRADGPQPAAVAAHRRVRPVHRQPDRADDRHRDHRPLGACAAHCRRSIARSASFSASCGALFILSLAFLLIEIMVPQPGEPPDWLREAKSTPYLQQGAEMLRNVLPEIAGAQKTSAAVDDLKTKSVDQVDKAIRAYVNPAAPAQTAGTNRRRRRPISPATRRRSTASSTTTIADRGGTCHRLVTRR